MSQPIATLRDDFEDNAIAAAWDAVATGSATVAETSAQARFTLPSSTAGSHVAHYTSDVAYDLTSGSFYITIGTMVSTSVAATAFFQLYFGTGANALLWVQLSGTIYARSTVAGVSTDQFSAAWSGTTYKYLRIRADTTTVYWDSSSNGTSWTNRASVAVSSLFAITDLFVDFGASCGNVASPGSFRLDDVNLILPALTTNWRWTQIVWPLTNRYKVVTLALDTVGTVQGYVVTADGVDVNGDPSGNVRYWSGPASDGRLLTEQTSDAAAKAMAVNVPVDGRFDLPTIIEARVIRVYHRSIDGSAYTLREVYPRRLVQADDIEAEAISALHIATLDLDAQHNITAAGGEVLINDIGISIITPQNTPADQDAYKFVKSDDTVLGGIYGYYNIASAYHYILAKSVSVAGDDSHFDIQAIAPSGHVAEVYLLAQRGGSTDVTIDILNTTSRQIAMSADSVYVDGGINIGTGTGASAGDVVASGGVNIGAASGAAAGQIRATINDSATNTEVSPLILGHNSTGTPAANFGTTVLMRAESTTTTDQSIAQITARWADATHASRKGQLAFFVYDTAIRSALTLEASGTAPKFGALGATAVTRPTVSGSRATDTWRQSLMTALANLGLVTDSSTA